MLKNCLYIKVDATLVYYNHCNFSFFENFVEKKTDNNN